MKTMFPDAVYSVDEAHKGKEVTNLAHDQED